MRSVGLWAAGIGAGTLATAWVLARRAGYRRRGRPLNEQERSAMAPYFNAGLLAAVRVSLVDRIADPVGVGLARRAGFRGVRSLADVRGMAFGDTVVLASAAWSDGGVVSRSVLFHELVHVAQYRFLGVHRFLVAYVRGWLANGRDYFAIPLEVQAYALQDRFDTGERFAVAEEVRPLTVPRASRSSR